MGEMKHTYNISKIGLDGGLTTIVGASASKRGRGIVGGSTTIAELLVLGRAHFFFFFNLTDFLCMFLHNTML